MAFNPSIPVQESPATYSAAPWMCLATFDDDEYADLLANVTKGFIDYYVALCDFHPQVISPNNLAMFATPVTYGTHDKGMMFVNVEERARNKGIYPGVAITLIELMKDNVFDLKQLKLSYPKTRSNYHGPLELEYFNLRKRRGIEPVLDIVERLFIDFDYTGRGNIADYRLQSSGYEVLALTHSLNNTMVEDTILTLDTPNAFYSWLEPRIGLSALVATLGYGKPHLIPEDMSSKNNRQHHATLMGLAQLISRRKICVDGLDRAHFDQLLQTYS